MIAVIADDITGAGEVAGVCLRYGLSVSFTIEVVALGEVDVIVIATDTRSLPLQKAVELTFRLSSELHRAGVEYIFKKTDSVLRGHVVAELQAVLQALGKSKALLVPANPETGRIISGGNYYVNDVPLNKTSFAGDPDFPALSSEVERILGMSVSKLHAGKTKHVKEGITIPDIVSEKDLETQATLCSDEIIPAGSAAFFEAYLKARFSDIIMTSGDKEVMIKGKVLMVCGSTHENSRGFIRKAMEKAIAVSEMPQELLKQKADPEIIRNWVNEISHLFDKVSKVIVAVPQHTVNLENSSKIIKETLTEVTQQVLSRSIVRELFIEGGATAFAIVRKLGFESLTPVSELEKGVVRMKALGPREFFITIKPGSYRWPEGVL